MGNQVIFRMQGDLIKIESFHLYEKHGSSIKYNVPPDRRPGGTGRV